MISSVANMYVFIYVHMHEITEKKGAEIVITTHDMPMIQNMPSIFQHGALLVSQVVFNQN
jgi:hypothetical protein